MSGFHVDLQALEAHERELRALIAGLPDAAADASQAYGDPYTWGIVGQFFAEGMDRWTEDAVKYAEAVKAAGDSVVERFAGMRQTYADQDEAVARSFKKLREGLDGMQP